MRGRRGRPWRHPREVLNGILWVLCTGARWKDLRQLYAPYKAGHRRFQRWVQKGVMERRFYAVWLGGTAELVRELYRWDFCEGPKGGEEVGKTKVGKGCKLMAGKGLPMALRVSRANPHEVKLVETTLEECLTSTYPERLIGEGAYDRDELDKRLAEKGIERIAPHRRYRHKARMRDGRKLRGYRRRWRVERVFAGLGNFRRLVVRWERCVANFVGFVHLAWILILLKSVL